MTDVEQKKRMFKVEKEIIVGTEYFLTFLKLISEIEQNPKAADKKLLLKMFKEDANKNIEFNGIKETIIDIEKFLSFLKLIVEQEQKVSDENLILKMIKEIINEPEQSIKDPEKKIMFKAIKEAIIDFEKFLTLLTFMGDR